MSKYSHIRNFMLHSSGYINFIITEKWYAKRKMAIRENECSVHSTPD
jgi:hypothetical protein